MKILIYGSNGWIGGQLLNLFRNKNIEVVSSTCRLQNYGDISLELDRVRPTHVLLAAGLTGRPNVDWCEDHKDQVVQVNVIGTSVLADECYKRNIHLTYFGTGCIYEYDSEHLLNNDNTVGKGFVEDDAPNFDDSFYSKTKIITENVLKNYHNVLILRIRMPLSDDLFHRNFITKITKYDKVVNIPNSMTILSEMLPIAVAMTLDGKTGIYNFTNPGVITHNEILTLYKEYIDPEFKWSNFTIDEQAQILKAGRSNNFLDTSKLTQEYAVDHISVGIVKLFERMKINVNTHI